MTVTTGFEASGYTEWTTLEEEVTLYEALEDTGRVTVTVLGESSPSLHAPIRRVTVALPETPVDAPSILYVALQHGNEPAGRESLLSMIRDLATTTSPRLLNLLSRCRFVFLPTSSPNAFPNSRNFATPDGAGNPNREHVSLRLLESQYIQQSITDVDPVAVIDCHEHFSPRDDLLHIALLADGHPSSDQPIHALSEDLMSTCQARLDSLDIHHWVYAPTSVNPWILRVISALRNRVRLLIESPARGDIVPRRTRFNHYQVVQDAILDWLHRNVEHAARELQRAKIRTATSTAPFDLNTMILNPRPAAYTMPSPAPWQLDVHGVNYTESNGTVTVPMSQPQGNLVPFLLDTDGPVPITLEATRVAPTNPPPQPDQAVTLSEARMLRLRQGDHLLEVEQVKYQANGGTYTVWPSSSP